MSVVAYVRTDNNRVVYWGRPRAVLDARGDLTRVNDAPAPPGGGTATWNGTAWENAAGIKRDAIRAKRRELADTRDDLLLAMERYMSNGGNVTPPIQAVLDTRATLRAELQALRNS